MTLRGSQRSVEPAGATLLPWRRAEIGLCFVELQATQAKVSPL
jgi:hypothetical protein